MFCGCLGLLAQVKCVQEAIYFIAVHWLTKTDADHRSAATPFGLSLSRPACTVMALRQAQGERWRDVYRRLELNRLAFGHRHHTGLAAFHRRLKFGQRAFGQHWRSASLSSWLRNASAILPMRLRWRSEAGCFGAASSNEWLCRRRSRSRVCRWSGRHAWCRAVCWSGRHSTIPEKHRER